jgi:hypothetical protein
MRPFLAAGGSVSLPVAVECLFLSTVLVRLVSKMRPLLPPKLFMTPIWLVLGMKPI